MKKKLAAVGAIGVIGLAGVALYAGVLGTLTAGTIGAGDTDLQASCATTASVAPGEASWDPNMPEADGGSGTGNFAYSRVVISFVPGDGLTCEGQNASVVVYNKTEGSTEILSRNASPHKVLKAENEARTFTISLDTKIPASVKNDDYRYGLIMQGPNPTSAPTNVVAIGDDRKLIVSWNAPGKVNGARVTDYVVEYAVVTDEQQGTIGAWQPFAHESSAQTSIEITGLTNGTLYHVRVAAKNSAGVSEWAQTQSAARAMTRPSAPQSLQGTHTNAAVNLTWTAPSSDGGSPIGGYAVRWYIDGQLPTELKYVGNVTTYTATPLTNGQPYYLQVQAVNAAGGGAFATVGPIVPRTVPLAPQNLNATVSGAEELTITWSPPTDNGGAAITAYQLTMSSDGGQTYAAPTTGTCAANHVSGCTVTQLLAGTTYSFKVLAVNSEGAGPETAPASRQAAVVPAAPTDVATVVRSGVGSFTLTWTEPSNGYASITSRQIQGMKDSGSGWTDWMNVTDPGHDPLMGVGPCSWTNPQSPCALVSATVGTSYRFRVKTRNVVGDSAWSDPSAPIIAAGAPEAPTNVVATATDPGQLTVTWTEGDDNHSPIIGHNVSMAAGAGGFYPVTAAGTCREASAMSGCTVTGLTPGQTYRFRVVARNTASQSAPSEDSAPVTAKAAPLTPAFGTPSRTATGYTVPITNYDGAFTWTGTATSGGTVSFSEGNLIVTGLTAGTSSTATIFTNRTDYLTGSATVTEESLQAALVPTFGTPTSTDDGFTLQITNYDDDWDWNATTPLPGSVTIDDSGLITVTGLQAGELATVSVLATRSGYAPGSAVWQPPSP